MNPSDSPKNPAKSAPAPEKSGNDSDTFVHHATPGRVNDDGRREIVSTSSHNQNENQSRRSKKQKEHESNNADVYDLGEEPPKRSFQIFGKKKMTQLKRATKIVPVKKDEDDEERGINSDVSSEIHALKTKIVHLETSHAREMQDLKRQFVSKEEVRALLGGEKVVVPDGSATYEDAPAPVLTKDGKDKASTRNRGGFSFFRTYDKVINASDDEGETFLDNDTFTLMMVHRVRSQAWALGVTSYFFEMVLGSLIALDQINLSDGSSVFDVPYNVDNIVRVGQCLSVFLCLSTQTDMLTSVQSLVVLRRSSNWDVAIGEPGRKSSWLWIIRILFPNLLKFSQGLLVMFVSFVIIVQSDNIIDLLKDFTALMVLSETDNIMFHLASQGYLGHTLMRETAESSDRSVDTSQSNSSSIFPLSSAYPHRRGRLQLLRNVNFRPFILISLFAPMLAGWIVIIRNQINGNYFRDKYPKCTFPGAFELAKKHFGDGTCYGGPLNSLDCEFEDGDCVNFNLAYPLCKGRDDLINVQDQMDNGVCDPLFTIPDCDYDGGDCCPYTIINSETFGDGQCNGGRDGTLQCGFDNGDCNEFGRLYPNCPYLDFKEVEKVEMVGDIVLGDGVCDSGIYSIESCGFEFGDCDLGQIGQDLTVDSVSDLFTYFSLRMSLDGRTMVFGSPSITFNSLGFVKVLYYDESRKIWKQRGNTLTGTDNVFGDAISVARIGNRIAVGDPIHSNGEGFVQVLDYISSSDKWVQIGQTIKPDAGNFAETGKLVELTEDGSRLAISEPAMFWFSGQVSIYEMDTATQLWNLLGNALLGGPYQYIGSKTLRLSSTNGNTIMFESGNQFTRDKVVTKVYGFDSISQDWVQLGNDIPTPYLGDSAMSSDGNRIVLASKGSVQAFDFNKNNNAWDQLGKTINGNAGFGTGIAMSSDGQTLSISSTDPECTFNALCNTGEVKQYIFNPTENEFIGMLPISKLFDTNAFPKREVDHDNTIFGQKIALSGDGSFLSIGGYDLINDRGFARVYELDKLYWPKCVAGDKDKLKDSECHDEFPNNSEMCEWDGGDCEPPKEKDGYPGCFVTYPESVGNGHCAVQNLQMYNTSECKFDGGDCLSPDGD